MRLSYITTGCFADYFTQAFGVSSLPEIRIGGGFGLKSFPWKMMLYKNHNIYEGYMPQEPLQGTAGRKVF